MCLNIFEFVLCPCDGRKSLGGWMSLLILAWDLAGDRISVRDVGVSLDPLKDRFGEELPGPLRTAHYRREMERVSRPPWFRFSCDLSDHGSGSPQDETCTKAQLIWVRKIAS